MDQFFSIRTVPFPVVVHRHFETDGVSFDQFPDVLSHTHCSLCGLTHVWRRREAWLTDLPRWEWEAAHLRLSAADRRALD